MYCNLNYKINMKELICKKIIGLQTEFNDWVNNDERFGYSFSPLEQEDREYKFLFCPKEIDFKNDDPKEILESIMKSLMFSFKVLNSTVTVQFNGIKSNFSFGEFVETFSQTCDFLEAWVKYLIDQNPRRSEA